MNWLDKTVFAANWIFLAIPMLISIAALTSGMTLARLWQYREMAAPAAVLVPAKLLQLFLFQIAVLTAAKHLFLISRGIVWAVMIIFASSAFAVKILLVAPIWNGI